MRTFYRPASPTAEEALHKALKAACRLAEDPGSSCGRRDGQSCGRTEGNAS